MEERLDEFTFVKEGLESGLEMTSLLIWMKCESERSGDGLKRP